MPRKVHVNGIEFNYELKGPKGAPVVMLSNSLLTDFRMWDPQIAAFTREFQVLRYDTRGHGQTQASPGPYSMEMLAADALHLLNALSIEHAHFVGLSLGGMVGQRLAAEHGERFRSVTLCDTACQMPPASAWNDRIKLAREQGTSAFVGPMTERWLTGRFREHHPEVVSLFGDMISQTSVDGLIGCAHAIRDMDHSELLARIAVPTLIIVGEYDVGTPITAAEMLHRGIRDSKLVVVQQSGHMPNVEQTIFFDRTVLDFMEKH